MRVITRIFRIAYCKMFSLVVILQNLMVWNTRVTVDARVVRTLLHVFIHPIWKMESQAPYSHPWYILHRPTGIWQNYKSNDRIPTPAFSHLHCREIHHHWQICLSIVRALAGPIPPLPKSSGNCVSMTLSATFGASVTRIIDYLLLVGTARYYDLARILFRLFSDVGTSHVSLQKLFRLPAR